MALTRDEWLAQLEQERYSTAYRTPKPEPEPRVVYISTKPKVDKKAQRQRDTIMFQAGRYAAGARDPEAIAGNAEVARIIRKG